MAYKVIILYQLYMPSYFLGTFTEYPYLYPANLSLHPFADIIPPLSVLFFQYPALVSS